MSKMRKIIGDEKYNSILNQASYWVPHSARGHIDSIAKILFDELIEQCPEYFKDEKNGL